MSDDEPSRRPQDDAPYPWMRFEPEDEDGPPPFRPWMIVVAGLSVLIFVVAVWYAWNEGREAGDGPPPVVEAEDGPVKVPPEEPGGMEVPHQDKTVFNAMEEDGGETTKEELLPPPEEPVQRPESAPSEGAGKAPPPGESPQTGEETAKTAKARDPDSDQTAQADLDSPSADAESGDDAAAEPDVQVAAEPQTADLGNFAVQLAALKSRDAAANAWGQFVKSFPKLLGPLSRDIEAVSVDGNTLYRIRAAGLETRPEAEELCESLKAQGQSCLVKKR